MLTSVSASEELSALPLLLLPGTLCDARVFAPMMQQAALDPARVIHADMTGLPSARALAERALAAVSGRFIPVGFSLGAIVALEMALIAPERIAGMVLIAANARDIPQEDHAARRQAAHHDPSDLVGNVLWGNYVAASRLGDEALKSLIVAMALVQPADTLPLQIEVALTRSDKRPHLSAMAMPALILSGEEDAVTRPELQQEIAAAMPNATLVTIHGAGHFLPLECPDLCAHALSDWMAQHRALV